MYFLLPCRIFQSTKKGNLISKFICTSKFLWKLSKCFFAWIKNIPIWFLSKHITDLIKWNKSKNVINNELMNRKKQKWFDWKQGLFWFLQ